MVLRLYSDYVQPVRRVISSAVFLNKPSSFCLRTSASFLAHYSYWFSFSDGTNAQSGVGIAVHVFVKFQPHGIHDAK